MGWLVFAAGLYVIIAAVVAIVGTMQYMYNRDSSYRPGQREARDGARLVLKSPLWPLLALDMLKEMREAARR